MTNNNLSSGGQETFSEWAERVWQARREEDPRNDTARVAAHAPGDAQNSPAAETAAHPVVTQQAIKWLEEGWALVGLLQQVLDQNDQLRARAAGLEQELERLRQEEESAQPEPPEIVEVTPKGGLDMASVAQMKLQELLNAGKSKLVLDLANVDYIDSAGLGEIVRAMKRAREAEGDLRLCGVRGQVLRIMEITGLNKALAVYPTREEAIASWN